MIIIRNYQIITEKNGDKRCLSLEKSCRCPLCGGVLKPRDSRKRIMKSYDGDTSFIRIRRLICINCGRIHNELPDILVPDKHYATEIIENVIDNTVTCEDRIVENYPSELTMKRWKKWFCKNVPHIKNILFREKQSNRTIYESLENYSYPDAGWLSSICSFIYNTGTSLLI